MTGINPSNNGINSGTRKIPKTTMVIQTILQPTTTDSW